MIFSMTGFAVASQEVPGGVLTLELRSVNHRYLDIQFRLPDEFRMYESAMREAISAQVSRGKIDCRMAYAPVHNTATALDISPSLLAQLGELDLLIRRTLPQAAPLSVAEALRWPGMLASIEIDPETLQNACLGVLGQALTDLRATRQREGEKLRDLLLQRVTGMDAIAGDLAPLVPGLVSAFQEKLNARLREALTGHDEERVRQEVAVYAQKIDVDEEISRLQTHLSEVRRILQSGGTVGKRLDFLMQELNREANTLGSKSVSSRLSQASIEMKILIEQMREQIQNVE